MSNKNSDEQNFIGNESKRWLVQAKEDLKSAEILQDGQRYYLVCFLSQQIAEKVLKSFLYAQGEDLIFGHSVAKLCDRCSNYDDKYIKLKKEIKNLDQYYIEARYPNGLPESVPAEFFDESDALHALEMARKAVSTVEESFI